MEGKADLSETQDNKTKAKMVAQPLGLYEEEQTAEDLLAYRLKEPTKAEAKEQEESMKIGKKPFMPLLNLINGWKRDFMSWISF